MPKWKSPDRRHLVKNTNVGEGFYVYFLMDIKNVFYVGKGTGKRWKGHFHDCALSKNSYKNHKIKGILEQDRKVNVEIVAKNLSEQEALVLESKLIEDYGTYRNSGTLCNIYTGDFRKSTESYQWDDERKATHSIRTRGQNSTGNEELVKKAKCLVHYRGMGYEEVSKLQEFVEAGVTYQQVKTWCIRQTFGYLLPHLNSIHEIREEQKLECYNLWKRGFLQKQVADILGIDFWKVKSLIQAHKKELQKESTYAATTVV